MPARKKKVAKKGAKVAKKVVVQGKKPAAEPGPVVRAVQVATAPRAPGEVRHWLVKSEPEAFAWDDLERSPGRTTCWDGVRNYQARNLMRDGMRMGDRVLFYHSNAEPPAVVGVCEVVREAYPDHTAFDPTDPHHDPASRREEPTWLMVDVRAVVRLPRPVSLMSMRDDRALDGMEVARRGSRLSVQPVTPAHYRRVLALGGLAGDEA